MPSVLEGVVRDAAAAVGAPDCPVVSETPPTPEHGDIAFPTAFGLARRLRRPPLEIAKALAEALDQRPEVRRVEVARPGYVNVFLHRERWLRGATPAGEPGADAEAPSAVHIVEHTCINPNKAAHIGHLRNAALGDSFVRILRFLGRRVEVHNYIDDTGVQVADVVLGFVKLRGLGPEEVRRLAAEPRFDYRCWDLYTEVSRWIESDPAGATARGEALLGLEHGDSPWAEIGEIVAEAIARRHIETMARIGVRYDLLPCEGTVLRLRFWEHAFEKLKAAGAVRLSDSGKTRGCWVMDTDLAQDGQKVIVRSNGTVTYVGKDIPYQLWQIGRLGRDFRYRRFFDYPDGHTAWITTDRDPDEESPSFGAGALVHHVIDARQSYAQQVVQEAVARLTSDAESARTRHFAYEMVALTPATLGALGLSGSDGAGAVEVSGRKGIGVKADDFLDALIERARVEVAARNPELPPETEAQIAHSIGVGALRYLMVRVTKNQLIVFDLEEALSFDGATGPYLQYAAVRARNIMAKLGLPAPSGCPPPPAGLDEQLAGLDPEEASDLWVLVREAQGLRAAAERSVAEEDPQILARWAYEGAQRFNAFYHRYRIAGEPDAVARRLRTFAVETFLARHARGLDLLGIPVPERM